MFQRQRNKGKKKMKFRTETSRLYVSADKRHEGVYFARTNVNKFARFYQSEYGWEIWIYPYKVSVRAHSLTETLDKIEHIFKKYWSEKI